MGKYYYVEKDKNGKVEQKLRIKGIDNLSIEVIQGRINQGYRFVVFNFAIFLVFLLWKKNSSIYFVEPDKSPILPKVLFSFISMFFFIITGAYFYIVIRDTNSFQDMDGVLKIILYILLAIGIIVPIPSIFTNIRGGKDVTESIFEYLKMQINSYGEHIVK